MSPDYREFMRRRHRSLAAWLSLFQSRSRAHALIIRRKPLLDFLGITRMKDKRLDAFKEDVGHLFPIMAWYIAGGTQTWQFRGTFSAVFLAFDKKLSTDADLVFRNRSARDKQNLNYVTIGELPADAEIADDLARSAAGLTPKHLEAAVQQYLPKGLFAVEIRECGRLGLGLDPYISAIIIREGFDWTIKDGFASLSEPKEPLHHNIGIPPWLKESTPGKFSIRYHGGRIINAPELPNDGEPKEVFDALTQMGFHSNSDFCQAVATTRDSVTFHPLGTFRRPEPEPEVTEEPAPTEEVAAEKEEIMTFNI